MIKHTLKAMLSNLSNFIIMIFVAILAIPLCALLKENGFIIINGFLTTMAFMLLSYQTAWKAGWKDVNYLKIHNIKFTPLKGFLIPIIPYVFALVCFIIYKITESGIAWILFYGSTIYYSGFITLFPNAYPYAYLVAMLLTCAVTGTAYLLGYKRISLSVNIMYKKDKDEDINK